MKQKGADIIPADITTQIRLPISVMFLKHCYTFLLLVFYIFNLLRLKTEVVTDMFMHRIHTFLHVDPEKPPNTRCGKYVAS